MTANTPAARPARPAPRSARPADIDLPDDVLGRHLATPEAILNAAPDAFPAMSRDGLDKVADLVGLAERFSVTDDPAMAMAQSVADTTSQRRSDMLVGGVVNMTPRTDDGRIDMEQFCVVFGRALRARRVLNGEEMSAVARKMQVSKQYISHVELGKGSFMAMMTYALHLGVRPSSILRPLGL